MKNNNIRTSFWVYLYAKVLAIMLILQAVPVIFQSFNKTGLGIFLINMETIIPIGILAWGWTALTSIYIITCKTGDIVATVKEKKGSVKEYHREVAGKVTVISLLLMIESIILSFFSTSNFGVAQLAGAFVGSAIFTVGGAKGVRIAGSFGPSEISSVSKIIDGMSDENEKPEMPIK